MCDKHIQQKIVMLKIHALLKSTQTTVVHTKWGLTPRWLTLFQHLHSLEYQHTTSIKHTKEICNQCDIHEEILAQTAHLFIHAGTWGNKTYSNHPVTDV